MSKKREYPGDLKEWLRKMVATGADEGEPGFGGIVPIRKKNSKQAKEPKVEEEKMAKIETMLVYHVVTNSDTTEGRGHDVILGMYDNPAAAEASAKGRGVFGSNAEIRKYDTQVVRTSTPETYILGRRVESTYTNPEDIKAAALAKLTPEERRILGV